MLLFCLSVTPMMNKQNSLFGVDEKFLISAFTAIATVRGKKKITWSLEEHDLTIYGESEACLDANDPDV